MGRLLVSLETFKDFIPIHEELINIREIEKFHKFTNKLFKLSKSYFFWESSYYIMSQNTLWFFHGFLSLFLISRTYDGIRCQTKGSVIIEINIKLRNILI